MEITRDTLVSEVLDEYPDSVEVFAKHGVDVHTDCQGCTDNPLDLCETLCDVADIDQLILDLQAFCSR